MAELETVPALRQSGEHCTEPFVVAAEVRGELPQHGPELRRPNKRYQPLVVALQSRVEVSEPLDVREVPARLDREDKTGRRFLDPARDRRLERQPVEGVVDLDRVEVSGVVLQPEPRRLALVELFFPGCVVPAGTTYADRALASFRHSSGVPAATTRERPCRSSGAEPNGGASKRSIASPRSRTRSCAAAMSTALAGLSEQTASTRPAARWQSERASEPMMRRRYASSTTAAACSATDEVRVASKERISMRSFGSSPSSRRPLRNAPWPRVAVHSSSVPKSCTNPNSTSPIVGPDATATESEKKPMPRFAFSEPSIGSITTCTLPSPTLPTSSDTNVTSSTPSKRASPARSAAWSIAVVASPPSPWPTTGSRRARVGSSAST